MPDWYSFLRTPKAGSFIVLSPDRTEENAVLSRALGRAFPAVFLCTKDAAYELFSGSLWNIEALRQNFYRELTEEDAQQLLAKDEGETVLEESLDEAGLERLKFYRSLLTPESTVCLSQLIAKCYTKQTDELKRVEAERERDEQEAKDRKRVSLKVDDVPRDRLGDYVGNLAVMQQTRLKNKSRKGKIRQLYDKVRTYLRE